MSEEKDYDVKLESEIQSKLAEVSNTVKLPFNEVLNASLLFSYCRFWYPLQKYFAELKVEKQPVKEDDYEPILTELKDQIESSYTVIQHIEKFEDKFERRFPFGTFQDFDERHWEFIKFIEESSIPKKAPNKVLIKKPIIRKIVEEIQEEEPSPQEPVVEIETFFKKSVAYFTPQIHGLWDIIKLLLFFILTGLACFYIFWAFASVWPIFNFVHFLTYYPYFVPFQILFIMFVILINGFIIGKLWYYLANKINSKIKRSEKR